MTGIDRDIDGPLDDVPEFPPVARPDRPGHRRSSAWSRPPIVAGGPSALSLLRLAGRRRVPRRGHRRHAPRPLVPGAARPGPRPAARAGALDRLALAVRGRGDAAAHRDGLGPQRHRSTTATAASSAGSGSPARSPRSAWSSSPGRRCRSATTRRSWRPPAALPGDPHRLRHRPGRPGRPDADRDAIATGREVGRAAGDGATDGMPRAIWSGSISFGLVNIPVKLYSAVSPQDRPLQPARPQHRRRASSTRRCRPRPATRSPTTTSSRATSCRRASTSWSPTTSWRRSTRRRAARSTSRSSSTSPTSTRSSTTRPTTWRPTRPRSSRTPCWPGPWRSRARSASPGS